jgi:uncharacterized RDD family membrane protein YckC
MTAAAFHPHGDPHGHARRRRELVTPEGLSLPLTIASRAARAGALLIDIGLIVIALLGVGLLLALVGMNIFEGADDSARPAVELIAVLMILLLFFSRYGYFLFFELGPRGATPGKRALGIRVAARGGQRLTAEAVIARNLMRDAEVFIPLIYLLSGLAGSTGVTGVAAGIWLAIFVFFPCFNRDALRAGDLIAGTWVIEAERRRLPEVLSLAEDRSATYRFGEAELSVYGEHELQVLEAVLRQSNVEARRQVMEAICRKIGWEPGAGDETEFLETFYAALRAHLESNLRLGRRKKDKFDR